MGVGDPRELTAVGLRLLEDSVEDLAPVAVLHDSDAAVGHVPDVALGRLDDALGQDRRSRAEVEDPVAHGSPLMVSRQDGDPSSRVRSTLMIWELPSWMAESATASGAAPTCIRASVACAP